MCTGPSTQRGSVRKQCGNCKAYGDYCEMNGCPIVFDYCGELCEREEGEEREEQAWKYCDNIIISLGTVSTYE